MEKLADTRTDSSAKKTAFQMTRLEELILSAELNRDPRASRDVGSGERRLLASYSAADGFKFEASILCSFYCSAEGLSDK